MNKAIHVQRSHMLCLFFLLGAMLLAACGSTQNQQGGPITITLAGPNQWNSSGKSFGPGWDTAVKQFEALNPGVTVNITVLPLSNFSQIEATDLASGSAPDLIFNQTSYKPYQITPLDSYLQQPNPYAPGKAHWMDWFDSRAYNQALSTNGDGHFYWVPLNLVSVGLFVNLDMFNKVGVPFPIKTYADWQMAVQKFKAAGITPMAMDNSQIGIFFPVGSILNQMMSKYYDDFNWFDAAGKPGSNTTLTLKDMVRAIKTGKLNAESPEFVKALQLAKETYSTGATPNWTGIKGLSGAGVNLDDFLAGRSAMAWGVNFGAAEVSTAKFKVGSMGFPTITTDTTPLSTNQPAQFGVTTGGTSYMIPSTVKGDHLKYAVRFLQFMTAPKYSQAWITTTTGVPSVIGVTAPSVIKGFSDGAWGESPKSDALALQGLSPQEAQDYTQIMQGYLLGTTSLSDAQSKMDASWKAAADYQIQQNPNWQNESWAK